MSEIQLKEKLTTIITVKAYLDEYYQKLEQHLLEKPIQAERLSLYRKLISENEMKLRELMAWLNGYFEGQEIPEVVQLVGKAYAALIVEDGVITHVTTTTLIEEISKDG